MNVSELKPLPDIETGFYTHYRGDIYEVLGVLRHSENLEALVHYRHFDDVTVWVRPFDMFFGDVENEGKLVKRFVKNDD